MPRSCTGARVSTPRSTGPPRIPATANPLEREFLAAGGAAHDHELRTARRTARRLRSLTIGLAVLLVVALVAGTVALVQRGNANQQASRANDAATLARATQLATEARTLPATQNDLALLLGVEGRRLQPSPTTDGGLEAAIVHRPPGLERVVHFGTPAAYASLSDDGRFVVAPGNDGNVRIYDFATGRLLRTLRGTHDPPFVAFFNSDDSLIVTGGIHGKITIWRVATGKPIGPPIRAGGKVVYGVFSGGTGLYTVSDTGVFAQWDFRDPKRPRLVGELFRFPLGQNEVPVAAFGGGPDRNIMAAGGSVSLPTTIFDVATHRHIADVVGTPGNFSPDGTLLATSLADHVVLWDAATGAERRDLSLGTHPVAPGSGGFSPDGRFLTATDQDDNAIRVFDIASGQQVGQPLQVPSSFAFGGSLLPGNRMVTIDADEAAIWQLDAHVPRAGNGPRRSHRRTPGYRERSVRAVHARRRRDHHRRRQRQTRPRVRCDLRRSARRPAQGTRGHRVPSRLQPRRQGHRLREHTRRRFHPLGPGQRP